MKPLLLWKTIVLLILSIVLLDAQSYIGSGSSWPIIQDSDLNCFNDPLTFVADNRSLCWYFQCLRNSSDVYLLFPKRCALGTYVSPSFTRGTRNPCSQRFPILGMYDCTRPRKIEAEVDCTKDLNCTNGGTPKQEDNICWCACPPDYQGSPNCSKAKGTTPAPLLNLPCQSGRFCEAAHPDGRNPCLNGGTCINQCTDFYCACPVPYTKTKYCERFSCSTTNFTCSNPNETCTRGLNGKDEFYVCRNRSCSDYLNMWMH